MCELRASGRYGRYIRPAQNGQPRIDQANVQALAKLDGKFVVHSNDDTLSAADLALIKAAVSGVACLGMAPLVPSK